MSVSRFCILLVETMLLGTYSFPSNACVRFVLVVGAASSGKAASGEGLYRAAERVSFARGPSWGASLGGTCTRDLQMQRVGAGGTAWGATSGARSEGGAGNSFGDGVVRSCCCTGKHRDGSPDASNLVSAQHGRPRCPLGVRTHWNVWVPGGLETVNVFTSSTGSACISRVRKSMMQ
jgi:hypothetical protein